MTTIPEPIEMLVSAGVRVFPAHGIRQDHGRPACTCTRGDLCRDMGKHPTTRNGLKDAATDTGTLEQWAARHPECNWGAVPPAGVVVLDVDPRNGGHDELGRLELEHGPLPRTMTARTGGGGLHLWFTGVSTVGKIGPGLDVKKPGGYLIVAPSRHRSGGRYEWADICPAAYLPPWLHAAMNPARAPQRTRRGGAAPGRLDGLVRFVEHHPDGTTREEDSGRNNALFWAACRAVENGLDTEPIRLAALRIGLDDHAVSRTIESAHRTAGAAA